MVSNEVVQVSNEANLVTALESVFVNCSIVSKAVNMTKLWIKLIVYTGATYVW